MATITYYDTDVWTHWQGTTATTDDLCVWTIWVDTATAATTTTAFDYQPQRPQLILQQREVRRLAEAQALRAQREQIEKDRADKARAEALLREVLNEEQVAQLEREHAFEVEAPSGKRYRIHRGRAGNVYSLDAKRRSIARHCIHPDAVCPDADTMLAQYLWLKWHEEAFLKTANITPLVAVAA